MSNIEQKFTPDYGYNFTEKKDDPTMGMIEISGERDIPLLAPV